MYSCGDEIIFSSGVSGLYSTWHLKVGEPPLNLMCCSLLNGLPTNLSSVDAIINMVGMLASSKVCLGNGDKGLRQSVICIKASSRTSLVYVA